MVALATAFISLRPAPDNSAFKAAGAKAGKAAGDAAGKGIEQGIDEGLERAKARAAANGGEAGKAWADGFHRDSLGKIRDAQGKFVASSITGGTAAGKAFGKGFGSGFGDKGGAFAGVAAVMAAKLTLIGAAGAAAAPGVVHLTAALAPAAGALVALPTAMAAFQAASATFKVATAGVGDAISAGLTGTAKQAEKAMEDLPPAAKTFAKSIISLKPALDGLRANVAQRFFLPLQDEVTSLAGRYLPMLRTQMSNLAGPLGGLGEQFAETARSAQVFGAVRGLFNATRISVIELRGAVDPALRGLAAGITGTTSVLPGMVTGFVGLTEKASAWVVEASKTGRLREIFFNAKTVILDVAGILGNVGSILRSVFAQANASGQGLLTSIRDLTGQVAAFFKSAQGSQALTSVFETLGTLGAALRTSLAAVLPAIGQSLAALGPAIAGMAGPAAQLVVALAPLLPLVAGIAATALRALTPAIAAVAGWMVRNEGAVKILAVALVGLLVTMKALAFVTTVQLAGGLVAFLKSTSLIQAATKAWAGAQWVLNAALTANPIGIAVVAIAALVAGVIIAYRNSEKFRAVVQATWAAIKVAVAAVVAWFTNTALPVLKAVWDGIAAGAKWLWTNGIQPAFKAIVGFLQGVVFPIFRALWDGVVKPVFTLVALAIKNMWTSAQFVFKALVFYLQNVVFPVIRFLWSNVVKPVFTIVGNIVKATWIVIQIAFKAWMAYMKAVVFPVIRFLYTNVVKPIFNSIGTQISLVWNTVVKPAFNALKAAFAAVGNAIKTVWNTFLKPTFSAIGSFIKDRVVPAFKTGVDGIKAAWGKIRDAAKAPVTFVVNKVVNPLIGGFNAVAGAFGVKTRLDKIPGFERGGRIPGRPSNRDNRLAAGPAGPLKVATGEFITNTRSTMANLGLVKAINAKRGKVTRADVDPYLDGFARGGMIGDGFGDFFNKLLGKAKAVGSAILHPKEALTKVANAAIDRIPGGGKLRDTLVGMGRKLVGGAGDWLKGKLGGSIGGGSVLGGYRGMQRLISARFPGLGMISGFRPGSRTLSGNRSYHASGRAVDYPPSRMLASWIKSTFGANTKELITPFQDLNLHNGRPHTYTGAVWNQHNFSGGNAHVHWAAALGGLVDKLSGIPVRLFDKGGAWPSGTLGFNGSGRTEYVDPNRRGGRGDVHLHVHNHGVIGSQREVDNWLVSSVNRLKTERRLPT